MGEPTAPPDIGDDVIGSEVIAEGVQRENESGHRVSDHRTTSSTPRARTADGGTARSRGQTWQKRQQPWSPSLGAGGSYEDPKDWGPDLRNYMSERNTAAERSFRVTRADPSSVYHTPREVHADHFRRLSEPGMTTAQCPTRRAEMQPVACVQQVDRWWSYKGQPLPRRPRVLPVATIRSMEKAKGGDGVVALADAYR